MTAGGSWMFSTFYPHTHTHLHTHIHTHLPGVLQVAGEDREHGVDLAAEPHLRRWCLWLGLCLGLCVQRVVGG